MTNAFIGQNPNVRLTHFVWSGMAVAGQVSNMGTFSIPDGAQTMFGLLLTPRTSTHISMGWNGQNVFAYSETYSGEFYYDALMLWI